MMLGEWLSKIQSLVRVGGKGAQRRGKKKTTDKNDSEPVPWVLAFMVNAGTLLIFLIGYLRDFMR
jgi:hypothetical protein